MKKYSQKLKKIYLRMRYINDHVEYARKCGVTVGDNCFFSDMSSFGTEPYLINIGNHVMISFGCSFITHDGTVYTAKGITGRNDLWKYGRITIEDNVSIGANTTILPGVTIGKNSIVGACSLVTKSIPEGEVWGGVPARFIKKTDVYVEKLLATREMQNFDLKSYRSNKKEEILKFL